MTLTLQEITLQASRWPYHGRAFRFHEDLLSLLRLGQACKIGTVPDAFARCGKPHNTLPRSSQGLQEILR